MVPAYFGMLWEEEIPTVAPASGVSVDVIAGSIDDSIPPSPPPDSWASRDDSHLAIWLIRLEPGAVWRMPSGPSGLNRMLHCFQGDDVQIGSTRFEARIGVRLDPETPTEIVNHGGSAEFLLLQGRPIGAPVFQMGPFVMNSAEELRTAVEDYHRTQFGGWPWSTRSPVHDRSEGRFALHADGRVERRDMQPVQ
jgi:redox-sensitive bicupin YhaK (pirin superfamily)